MNTYEYLPLLDVDDPFFKLNQDLSKVRINELVGKHIIFDKKTINGIELLTGKLLRYAGDHLFIRQYDDGTKQTRKLWVTTSSEDLFKNFEEKIDIRNIAGIEEYKKVNSKLKFKQEYKNVICEITNKHNKTLTVLINGFDGYEIQMELKYKLDNTVYIGEYFYPLYLLKNIKVK